MRSFIGALEIFTFVLAGGHVVIAVHEFANGDIWHVSAAVSVFCFVVGMFLRKAKDL